MQRIQEDFAATADARAALEKNRDDAAANLAVGKFYCFSKGDWEKGLPLLARGADAALKSVAEKEQANPNTAEERLGLADQWWQLADGRRGRREGSHATPRRNGIGRRSPISAGWAARARRSVSNSSPSSSRRSLCPRSASR